MNRMYIAIKGLWTTADGYLNDLTAACKGMSTGFSIHVDLITMKPVGRDLGVVHEEAQKILLSHGLAHTAEVQNDRALLRMAVDRYSSNSGMAKQVFDSHEKAKAWLDGFVSSTVAK